MRSDRRCEEQLRRDAGRTAFALREAGQGRQQGHKERRVGADQADAGLPRELYKSLTWDRSKELGDHSRLSLASDVEVYFCDPQSPWQRGSNENTNRLLRQYFPKGTDLS